MKQAFLRLMLLCLAAALLLCACGTPDTPAASSQMTEPVTGSPEAELPGYHFSKMKYTRPELDGILASQNACAEFANKENWYALREELGRYLAAYSSYQTNLSLATLHYHLDMTDRQWEAEYQHCTQIQTAALAGHEALMQALANSTYKKMLEGDGFFGPGFFDRYTGDSLWTGEFATLMSREQQLRNEYYAVCAETSAAGDFYTAGYDALSELLAEMVKLRRQIATAAGYADYPSFAYDFYFGRDYTPEDAALCTAGVREYLTPLYLQTAQNADSLVTPASEADTLAYLQNFAEAVGGTIEECYRVMTAGELYHIRPGEAKLTGSYCTYLPVYRVPFVFVSPTGTCRDHLTFTHEFGHFCNDYVSGGPNSSTDTAEFFSQGLEYLSLCYADGGQEAFKLYDGLRVYVQQAALAQFELELYALKEDAITPENIRALYSRVCRDFGSDADSFNDRSFTGISHFYTSPLYVISYVLSNDGALQLYQMECAQPGSGLQCYTDNLGASEVSLSVFLDTAGLQSPFAPGRIQNVRDFFAEKLRPQEDPS